MNSQSIFRRTTVSLFIIAAILNFFYIAIEIVKIIYSDYYEHAAVIDYKTMEIIFIIALHLLISISAINIVYKFDGIVDEYINKSIFRRFLLKEYVYVSFASLSFAMMAFSYLILLRAIELFS